MRAETYDARMGGPLPWIVRVARNFAIDRLRARRVRAAVDGPAIDFAAIASAAPDTAIQTPEAAVLIAERRRTLTDALAFRRNSGSSSTRPFSRGIRTASSHSASNCRSAP